MGNQQLLFNRYQLGSLLGEGGMGAVYRGIDTQTNQPVAIKRLKPEKIAGQPNLVARFSREAEALRTLNHPNIVKVFAAFTEENLQYIVMEYIGGGSLHDLLHRKGQLTITETLEIALDLSDALTRAHRLEIIHRDLKPANVLLADDGTARLSDFGIAKMADAFTDTDHGLTKEGMIMGTIEYLSPEACRGEVLDARIDIWALGCILFEMLVGKRPFPHPITTPTIVATLSAILTQPTPDLESLRPDTPEPLIDLIYRMLTKEREARIPSMRLVGAELEIILHGLSQTQHKTAAKQTKQPRFATPTPHPAGLPRHNLPKQTTPFIGREAELTTLTKLMSNPDNHLITLLGPGGTGKTRLALEFAKAQLSNFENGVTFVSLAPLNSAETILPAIAEAVGLQFFENVEPITQLASYFQEKQTLLVLDNFEHLLNGAHLVSEILHAAPAIKVLATSREKLTLQEEILFRIEGMGFPEEIQPTSLEDACEYSAIRLFTQAAKRARPIFELEMNDLRDIIHICQLVSGMPLGILLAAAWVEMFSPQEIAQEVSRNLDFLETEMRDMPERHRSIRAVFDSSWQQLTESQREIFTKLSLFRGGFTREAAQAVAGATLPTLIKLVSKSLLHRDPTSGRYEVHELLRQYAAEKLKASGGFDAGHQTHCTYFAKFMNDRLTEMLGPRQTKALDEIDAEFENVRQAWRWAVKQKDYDAIDQAAESLFVFSDMRSREYEGVALFEFAQKQLAPLSGEEPHPTWGRLLLCWYDLALQSYGRFPNTNKIKSQAETTLKAAQKHNDPLAIAYGLIMLGHFTKPFAAIKLYEQSLELVPRLDDSFWVRIRIGFCYQSMGEYHQAINAFQQSYQRGREINESEKMGWALHNIAETEILLGDYASALTHLQEANPHFHQVGTLSGIIWTNVNLSFIMLWNGNFEEANSLIEEAQKIASETNRANKIEKEALVVRSYLALMKQQDQKAKQLFEEHLSAFTNSPKASVGLASLAKQLQTKTGPCKPPPPESDIQSLVEPLSEREMDVLRLLKTELSGPEIARELMVSLNTVRFHTKNIYAKLQANNRRAAVNRAIELGL